MRDGLIGFVLGVVCSALGTVLVVIWALGPEPVRAPPGRTVTDTVIIFKDRPDRDVTLPERIFTAANDPTSILTSATASPDATRAYCAPRDTVILADTLPGAGTPAPAVLPPVSLRYQGKTLRIWTYLGDGRAYMQENEVRAPFTAVAADSTFLVRGPRFWWFPTLRNCVLAGAVGVGVSALTEQSLARGAALGCATSVVF